MSEITRVSTKDFCMRKRREIQTKNDINIHYLFIIITPYRVSASEEQRQRFRAFDIIIILLVTFFFFVFTEKNKKQRMRNRNDVVKIIFISFMEIV